MTTMPGNGPLPSGSARKALTSSPPDRKVISLVLTAARTGGAASASSRTAAREPTARRMLVPPDQGVPGTKGSGRHFPLGVSRGVGTSTGRGDVRILLECARGGGWGVVMVYPLGSGESEITLSS